MLGTRASIQSLTVLSQQQVSAAVSGCILPPAGSTLNLAEGWGCSQSQEPSSKLGSTRRGQPHIQGCWDRGQVAGWGVPKLLGIKVALEAHHQDSTATFSRQDTFLEAWAGGSARTALGPLQAGEDR